MTLSIHGGNGSACYARPAAAYREISVDMFLVCSYTLNSSNLRQSVYPMGGCGEPVDIGHRE